MVAACEGAADARTKCERGEWEACLQAATALMFCNDQPNEVQAEILLGLGCDGGFAPACQSLAGLLERSHPERAQRAVEHAVGIYQQACNQGIGTSCISLADLTDEGRVHDKGAAGALRAKGEHLLRRDCQGGSGKACGDLAAFYLAKGGSSDERRALDALEKGCTLGDSFSCGFLAGAHATGGHGARKNSRTAGRLFARACELGDRSSCGPAAELVETSEGLDGQAQAARYYTLACDGEGEYRDFTACYRLSSMYATGQGVVRNEERAAQLRSEACKGGCKEACH